MTCSMELYDPPKKKKKNEILKQSHHYQTCKYEDLVFFCFGTPGAKPPRGKKQTVKKGGGGK